MNSQNLKGCCAKEQKNVPSSFKLLTNKWDSYKPLIIILIFCGALSYAQKGFVRPHFMYSFMGYFFLFLSLFKFFDLKGFVEGFSTYDLLTQKYRPYGYLYPFLEFSLGIAYLTEYQLDIINGLTVLLMTMSGVGIVKSVFSGQKIKCVCLGTTLNVPLSTVSILENFGMGAMALMMIVF